MTKSEISAAGFNLCAMLITEQTRNSSSMSLYIFRSVSSSTPLVASSMTTIEPFVFLNIAVARQNNCCCPWERAIASMDASRPPRETMCSHRPTFVNADTRTSLSQLLAREVVRLRRTDPGRKNGVCGITMKPRRTTSARTAEMSIPSTNILLPASTSTRRSRAEMSVDLPLPVRPHSKTF